MDRPFNLNNLFLIQNLDDNKISVSKEINTFQPVLMFRTDTAIFIDNVLYGLNSNQLFKLDQESIRKNYSRFMEDPFLIGDYLNVSSYYTFIEKAVAFNIIQKDIYIEDEVVSTYVVVPSFIIIKEITHQFPDYDVCQVFTTDRYDPSIKVLERCTCLDSAKLVLKQHIEDYRSKAKPYMVEILL